MAKKVDFAARNQSRSINPDIFSKVNEEVKEESSTDISLEDIISFKNHPFKVIDDTEMEALISSIKENGIINPVIVRQDNSSKKYELISGHRRVHAAKKAGLDKVPAIVKDLTDEEATIMMVDSNIQRESLLPSEKAYAYKMKFDALSRQGKTVAGLTEKTTEGLGREEGVSAKTIERFIHLTLLIKELMDKTDSKIVPFTIAVELSYLNEDAQKWLNNYIDNNGCISLKQAKEIHGASVKGEISSEEMESILNPETENEKYKVMLSNRKLKKYFPADYTQQQVENVIFTLLEDWKKKNNPEKKK